MESQILPAHLLFSDYKCAAEYNLPGDTSVTFQKLCNAPYKSLMPDLC